MITALRTNTKKTIPRYADGGSTTQIVTNIPEYAQSAYADLVGRAQAQSQVPYQGYGGERVAQFTPLQQQGFQGIAGLGMSPYTQQAGGIAGLISNQAMNSYYNPSSVQTYGSGPLSVSAGAGPQQVGGPGAQQNVALGAGPSQVSGPGAQQRVAVGAGPSQVSGPGAQRNVAVGAGPSQVGTYGQAPQMTRTQSFLQPGTAGAYMNPYMQNVVDIQQRNAIRADDVARTSRNAQAVGAGAFGGSRQAIQEAEAAKNLSTQLGDIQAQGSNAAFQQAQAQFNQEQNLGLQSQQANQAAGLNFGNQYLQAQQANQQAGLTYGAQSLQAQQANQNMAAQYEQMRQQAQQANQQAGLTYGAQGLQAALANQSTGTQYAQMLQQAQQANQQAGLTYGAQGLQAQQANQNTATQYMQALQQARLANQQAGLTYGAQNLTAQQANQQAGLNFGSQYLDAQKLAEASRQFGASYGLQGLQTGLQGAGTLGTLGNNQFQQQYSAANAQGAAGLQQQQAVQAMLDAQYANYQQAQQYPYQQMGFMSDILRGTQGTSQYSTGTSQAQQPSNMQNLIGLGTALYGASKSGLFAEGGAIDGGLASIAPDSVGAFADGGIIGYAAGGSSDWTDFDTPPRTRDVGPQQPRRMPYGPAATEVVEAAAAPGRAYQAGRLAGRAARFAGAAALPMHGIATAYEAYNTPTEEYAKRFGWSPDSYDSFMGGLGVRAAGVADDLLLGAPSALFGPKQPSKPTAAKPSDKTDLGDVTVKDKEPDYSLTGRGGAGISGIRVNAQRPPTLEEMRASRSGIDADMAALQKQGLQSLRDTAAARKSDAEAGVQEVEDRIARAGELGEGREEKLKGRLGELADRGEKAKGDALMEMGFRILTTPPTVKGWRGALAPIAAGAHVGLGQLRANEKELRAEKARLDDAIDNLHFARRAENIGNDKERAAAKRAVRAAEIDATEKMGSFLQNFKLGEIKDKKELLSAYEKYQADYRQQQLHADEATARNQMTANVANTRFSGIGVPKRITDAQYAAAVEKAAAALAKSPKFLGADPRLIRAAAARAVDEDIAANRGGGRESPYDLAGASFSVRPD